VVRQRETPAPSVAVAVVAAAVVHWLLAWYVAPSMITRERQQLYR
jgi:hypothetical protein